MAVVQVTGGGPLRLGGFPDVAPELAPLPTACYFQPSGPCTDPLGLFRQQALGKAGRRPAVGSVRGVPECGRLTAAGKAPVPADGGHHST